VSHGPRPDSVLRRWFSTVPALLLLVWAVFNWTANSLSGKMIQVGEDMWQGYAIELRLDRGPPVAPAAANPAAATPGADDDLIGDLLGDDGADDDLIGDLLADEAPAAPPATTPAVPKTNDGADDDLIGDLLADEEPPPAAIPATADGADDDLIGDLLEGEDTPAPPVAAQAGPTLQDFYEEDLAKYEAAQARLTPTIRAYRWVDTHLGDISVWGSARTAHLLVLLLLVAGGTATATRGHIALRPARTLLDDRVSNGFQLVANGVVVASMVRLWQLNASSGTEITHAELPLMWAAAFGLMSAFNLYNLAKPGADLKPGGNLFQAGLTVPLYCGMAVISFIYFVVAEDYVAGLAVYLQKLTEHAELYVFVGLYVWAGMLLKRTRVAHLSFELLRPWKLPPELLAIVVVLAAAIPTAYSGASGIFVIAVGALIYSELREAGARRGLALAATAMSGSLGVVLRPCLLVVIVAYLNPPTTDVLYGWGRWVFLLTSGLFAVAVLLTRQNKLTMAPIGQALPESLKRLTTMLPYIGVAAVVLLAYYFGLDAVLDEHTAPVILPVALFALMAFERIKRPKGEAEERPLDQRPSPLDATSETTTHMGALVLLMSLSIALGGVFERSEIMDLVPQDLGSPWATMSLLVVVLIVIGMTMDPYGAVILVSATVAEVAYRNGIDEAHFWMVVLVAFELGYLTPPVALNHLLTRQVVGPDEVDAADQEGDSFWYRHERILLPVSVMSVALLLVAFVPLLFTTG
jgi:TRAP-type C4-dicarboxylate transport system permease large subunit